MHPPCMVPVWTQSSQKLGHSSKKSITTLSHTVAKCCFSEIIPLFILIVLCEFGDNRARNTVTVGQMRNFKQKSTCFPRISREGLDRSSIRKLRWKGLVEGYNITPYQIVDRKTDKSETLQLQRFPSVGKCMAMTSSS